MKTYTLTRTASLALLLIVGLSFSSCQKELAEETKTSVSAPVNNSFVEYVIRAGQQYSDQTKVQAVKVTSMKFTVKFDNSAIYTTKDPANQADINKLYGFSDNSAQHHEFSARFGWRWYNNKLNLQAYIYNNGVRDNKEIGDIDLNKEYKCEIRVVNDRYDFLLNGAVKASMPRKSAGAEASGYHLFPYFGGDELAPHEIKILVRDDN